MTSHQTPTVSPAQAGGFLDHEGQPPDLEVNDHEEEVVHLVAMDAMETQHSANPRQQTASPSDPVIHQRVTDAINRLKSRQSQAISEYVENWLKETAASREERLDKLREEAYEHFSNELERRSHDCYIAARMEFGRVIRDYGKQCEIAEQNESEILRNKLCFLCDKTCEDMPRLCVVLAGGDENSITLEVANEAGQFSFRRFEKLGSHAVDGVDKTTASGLAKVCETLAALFNDIAKQNLQTIQIAKDHATRVIQEGDDRFREKLSQTEPKTWKAKRKEKVAVPSSTGTSNVASTLNMGIQATRRERLRGPGHMWPSSQQGDHVGVTVGPFPLEAQQCEAPQVYESKPEQQEEVDQEREQGEQGAADEGRDSEQCQGQAMTESFQNFAYLQRMLATADESMQTLRQEGGGVGNEESQRAMTPTGVQGSEGDSDGSDPGAWEDAEDIEADDESDQRQPEPPADNRHAEPSVNSTQRGLEPSAEDRGITMGAGPSADPDPSQQERFFLALVNVSEAVARSNEMLGLILNHTMHPSSGATASPPTHQDSDPHLKKTGKFRERARVRSAIRGPMERKALDMRKAIREHANTMMKRTRNDKPEPANEEAINKYKKTGNVEDGPSKDQFQPDFSETRAEKSMWNIRLSEVFENDYVQNHLPVVEVKDVAKYFLAYLRSLQTSHRKKNQTSAGTNIAGGTAYDDAVVRNRRDKRKQTRFHQQISALHFYQLHRFVRPLTEMSYAALSDDESDHANGRSRYAILKEEWRSNELIMWLRTIDLLAFGEKWAGRIAAPRGNGIRHRFHSESTPPKKRGERPAVSGLPENCYDRDWLKSLNEYERRLLNIQPPLDLTFSEEERLQAMKYVLLAKGEKSVQTTNTTDGDFDFDDWLVNKFGKAGDSM